MDRAAFVSTLRAQYPGIDQHAAERAADANGYAVVEIPEVNTRALEKQIEHQCDVMMMKLGFEVIRFSQAGKTRQTVGIPDRRYMRRMFTATRAIRPEVCVWFECKAAGGRQRPGQKLFQELAIECGEHYVLGGIEELAAWLVEQRIAPRVGTALEPNTP